MKKCDAKECETLVVRARLCRIHYFRKIRNGDENTPARRAPKGSWVGIQCSCPGCDNPVKTMALCSKHYLRSRRERLKTTEYTNC